MKKNTLYKIILSVVVLIAITVVGGIVINRYVGFEALIVQDVPRHDGPALAGWLWDDMEGKSILEMDRFLYRAKSQGIATIYISVDKAVGAQVNREYDVVAAKSKSYAKFIGLAAQYGIDVQALAGDPSWSLPRQDARWQAVVGFVRDFNQTQLLEYKHFTGIQFDVEPYTRNNFNREKKERTLEFINFVERSIAHAEKNTRSLTLGYAIPFWYDSGVPEVEYNGAVKKVSEHIIDLLATHPDSYLVLMSYRDYAEGEDGTIKISKDELLYSESLEKPVSIYVGQEFTDQDLNKISYFEETKEEALEQLELVDKALRLYRSYETIAIHDISSFLFKK